MKRINRFYRNYYRIMTKLIYGRRFRLLGKKACLFDPLQIDNPKGISIGNNVLIAHQGWIMGCDSEEDEGLVINDGVVIGHYCHIIAIHSVVIEKNVLIADKVFICDSSHDYTDVEIPVVNQKIIPLNNVTIGEGSWIGENVCILGGSLGKHCVVAANSVITRDFPDYSVVAGIPAKTIKVFNREEQRWQRV